MSALLIGMLTCVMALQTTVMMPTTLAQEAPRLNITIRTDNKKDFEVGTPRVLACIVVGCAPSLNITWYLGEVMLRPNVYKEVNRGNFTVSSLTFVPSLSDNGKELMCRATYGHLSQVFEDRVTISVGQRPKCVDSMYRTIRAVEGESQTLSCLIESDPDPEQFVWNFPDGRTIYTSSKQKVPGHKRRYTSALVWVPQRDDFGPVYCRAFNRFGDQKQPCTFSVVRQYTPDCDIQWESQENNAPCGKKPEMVDPPPPPTPYDVMEINHPEDIPRVEVYKTIPRYGSVILISLCVLGVCFFLICIIQILKSSCHQPERPMRGHYVNNIELADMDNVRHLRPPKTESPKAGISHQSLNASETPSHTCRVTTSSCQDYEAPIHRHEYCI